MDDIMRLFPSGLREAVASFIHTEWAQLEEIRLRLNRPLEFIFTNEIKWLDSFLVTEELTHYILNKVTDHSLYRMDKELKEGYMTIEGGHRIGLAGEVTTLTADNYHLQYVTFLNIRIAKEIKDLALPIMPFLHDGKSFFNTLVIGPPQTGKTSLIRDLARLLGDGIGGLQAKKVAIIDERSEIAASVNGVPQHDVGLRTDVMDACPKTAGLMMMIRSMSPDILVVDEIGKRADATALLEAISAGVGVVCTVHGHTAQSVLKRPSLESLFSLKVFKRFIVLRRNYAGHFKVTVYDERHDTLYEEGKLLI